MATRVSGVRKTPRQQRSRATVEVIISAAARVLARAGWNGFTTNAVASAGGISVGSIYQYFPDKMALLDAVRHRHHQQVLQVLRHAAAAPWETRVEQLIDGLIQAHGPEPGLHRVLLQDCPPGPPQADDLFHQEYLKLYAGLFPDTPGRDRALQAQVLASAIVAVIHDVVCGPEGRDPRGADELIRMANAYVGFQK